MRQRLLSRGLRVGAVAILVFAVMLSSVPAVRAQARGPLDAVLVSLGRIERALAAVATGVQAIWAEVTSPDHGLAEIKSEVRSIEGKVGGGTGGDSCTLIGSLPTTISSPGRYCLGRPLTVSLSANADALRVSADDVVVDLRGFSITNTADLGSTLAVGIRVTSRAVTIRNGTVRRFLYGIYFQGDASEAGDVEGMHVADCTYGGIRVEGKGHVVRGNHVVHTTGSPYEYPSSAAIGAYGSSHHVLDNDVAEFYGTGGAEGWGIWMNACDYCIVERNRVGNSVLDPNTLGIGAGFSQGAMAVGNRIVNTRTGIAAYSQAGILYRENVTFGCTTPYGTGTDGGNNY